MDRIRLLEVGGSPFEMGLQHGRAYANPIRELTQERLHLCCDSLWTGRKLPFDRVLALAKDCLDAHYDYAPDLMAELEGMAQATKLTLPELIIVNGFTDFVDTIYNAEPDFEPILARAGNECTTFMAANSRTADGYGMLGQTWDMHETAMPFVILLRGKPRSQPEFLTFTLTGCIGMIGMNEAGIAVGINNLMGADGTTGVTWPFVVRKILQQSSLEDALDCITSAPLAGAHNYMLMDATGRGYNVEAMSTVLHIQEVQDHNRPTYTHANQCVTPLTKMVERPQDDDLTIDSTTRLQRAQAYLRQEALTPETLMALTRDRSDGAYSVCAMSDPPFYSATCGAAIMRPGTGEFWGVWGMPNEGEYERFAV